MSVTQHRHDNDRTTSVTPPSSASVINYTWEDNGDLTARGSDSFSWDYEDCIVSAKVNSVTTSFAYRGDGLRDSRTVGGNTTTAILEKQNPGRLGAIGCVAGGVAAKVG